MSTTTTHLDRKSLKEPDEFFKGTKSIFDHLAENSKAVAIVGTLFVLVAAGWAGWSSIRQGKEDAARNALYQARMTLDQELTQYAEKSNPVVKASSKGKSEKKTETAKPTADDVAYAKFDVDQVLSGSKKQLLDVASQHAGTRAAYEAILTLADLYYDHGQSAAAINQYQVAVNTAPTSFEKAMAGYALGYAFENEGKFADASAALEKALNQGESSLRSELLVGLGRNQLLNKNLAEAKKTFDKVISEFPGSDAAKTAESLKSKSEMIQ